MNKKVSSESVVKDIRRRTRKKYSSEEKIRIVLEGFQSRMSAFGRKQSLCRRKKSDGISEIKLYQDQYNGDYYVR